MILTRSKKNEWHFVTGVRALLQDPTCWTLKSFSLREVCALFAGLYLLNFKFIFRQQNRLILTIHNFSNATNFMMPTRSQTFRVQFTAGVRESFARLDLLILKTFFAQRNDQPWPNKLEQSDDANALTTILSCISLQMCAYLCPTLATLKNILDNANARATVLNCIVLRGCARSLPDLPVELWNHFSPR